MKVAMAEEFLKTRPTYAPDTDKMPLSPHLQIWKWTVTMASSILHRATGIALYAGSVLFTLWLLSAAVSQAFYNQVTGLLGSPLGLLVLAGFSWAMMYHLVNGIKYIIWDSGRLLEKETAKKVVWVVILLSFVLTGLLWAVALGMKG
ncbi:succinate dehydrogenase, cytochrome b556 subunit [Parvularcula marina]|nr:succinate dehydrogenase, cytochrome b556 subunit [Parvularcula marina]